MLNPKTSLPTWLLLVSSLTMACGDTSANRKPTRDASMSKTQDMTQDMAPEPDVSPVPDMSPEPDMQMQGCALLCREKNLDPIAQCLNDGAALSREVCLSTCEEESLARVATCVDEAHGCDEVRACFTGANNTPVAFEVRGTDAVMTGVIDARTIQAVTDLIQKHPDVTRIVMRDVPGSLDDTSNLRASRMIREAGLETYVPADGVIASGGVDFFCAGVKRVADVAGGARLGVHSWGLENGFRGDQVPRDHPEHQSYLDYYEEMGIPAEFYWFTLEAASPDNVHWMMQEEVTRYMLVTE